MVVADDEGVCFSQRKGKGNCYIRLLTGGCLTTPQAANEAMSGEFQRHAHSALLQLKERLQSALGTTPTPQPGGLAPLNPLQPADVSEAAAMLRRLQLHVVDSASLVKTGFASLIKRLKSHPNKEIAELARLLIKSWKVQLKAESKDKSTAGEAVNAAVEPMTAKLPAGIVSTGT